jgi:CDP-paratose 2-epimerase
MKYQTILITGGAGFVGSNLALRLKGFYPEAHIVAFDNLKRRGSELNIPRLKEAGIEFIHGDIRNKSDLQDIEKKIDLLIECSAEPSVLAGVNGSPEYLIDTNLTGTINCLELARKHKSHVLFLSTSRVYPIQELNSLKYTETEARFEWTDDQEIVGASSRGIAENFPLGKSRSLYGATKLCSELIFQEYIETYGLKGVINRCGVITGPWQMGKIDQGVIVLWMARHIWPGKSLSYIGYGGTGKQVRDFIHIDDVFEALKIQIENIDTYNGEVFNIGGGKEKSVSLRELTEWCEKITGNKITISSEKEDRPNDVRIYLTDSSKFQKISGWSCKKDIEITLREIHDWIVKNKKDLERILN